MIAPKLEAGKIYHLSHRGGTPADFFVDMVYMKPESKEWMYRIRSESNNCSPVYISESILVDRVTLRTSKVYKADKVISLINEGFRFAGNVEDLNSATQRGKEFAKNPNVHDVVLHKAMNPNGEEIGGYGIWIRWNVVLDDECYGDNTPIRIK